nr:retrovirus-related Pol polyprotein from transposon TNT 1-94 [Tanacetum cinerariifolium]
MNENDKVVKSDKNLMKKNQMISNKKVRVEKSVKYIFIGYPKETMGYYFYYPPKNKVVVEKYADFLEREFILQKESGRTVELDDEDKIPSENTSEHPIEAESLAPIIEEDVVPV